MSVKITSAQIDPQIVDAGTGYRLIVGVEAYGTLRDSSEAILCVSDGAELHTSDGLDYDLAYTGAQIDAAIGGLLSWTTT